MGHYDVREPVDYSPRSLSRAWHNMACMHWHWHWHWHCTVLHCTALALALALALLLTVMLTAMSALALSVKAAMLEADLRHAFRWEDGQDRAG